ncbi:dihydropyrimidinase [Virgibacillus sp. JSM 102003]|uniref:dihydropyrimidinase n=1 Tax=Virgibacillus sp. JSM 102003 TaxID=1562108 RepID=UPI0035BF6EF0
MKKIIQNGTIVTVDDIFKGDIQIEDGIITSISSYIEPNNEDHVIDANGQYVFPGGIDPHAHLANLGTVDDFNTGTKAAATGGITSIINYVDPKRGQSVIKTLKEWKDKAKSSCIDYGFHSIINESNKNVLEELPALAKDEGVTSIKLFMANQNKDVEIDDKVMYRLMKKAGMSGIICNVHAENGDVIENLVAEAVLQGNTSPIYHARTRPSTLESEATNRALRIAESAGAPVYIVHVTCGDALHQVIEAKKRGVRAYAETCPHYLVLDESFLDQPYLEGSKYVCSPPLRERSEQEELWKGIDSGHISTIGSDHSSIPLEGGKDIGVDDFSKIPNGCPGIENSFSLLFHFGVHEKRISLQKLVDVTSTGPAKVFGLYPKKGAIMVGSDADIVLLDPRLSKTISQKTQFQSTDYNIYEGIETQGKITHVLSRGELIVSEDSFHGKPGHGEYLHRKRSTD